MRKFTKTMAAVLSLTMTLTMVTPVFAEGETNIPPSRPDGARSISVANKVTVWLCTFVLPSSLDMPIPLAVMVVSETDPPVIIPY